VAGDPAAITALEISLRTGAVDGMTMGSGPASEPAASDAWTAAAFGIIPLAVGLGFFVDAYLIRRDLRAS